MLALNVFGEAPHGSNAPQLGGPIYKQPGHTPHPPTQVGENPKGTEWPNARR
jgi:hypothetical protein